MQTQNGHRICQNNSSTNTSVDTRQVSENSKPLTPAQIEFIGYVTFHGIDSFIRSLKMIHDFALYHTDLCFDSDEKSALFDLKILWEGFERIEEKT